MTATEVGRDFCSALDAVAYGETIVIAQGDRRVAQLTPASAANGGAVADISGVTPLTPTGQTTSKPSGTCWAG